MICPWKKRRKFYAGRETEPGKKVPPYPYLDEYTSRTAAEYLDGKDLRSFSDRELYRGYLGVMPQNPRVSFKKTVLEDLYSVIGGKRKTFQ